MRTDLRSLETLLAVAEHGGIGAAARALEVQQPSVTDQIKRLERHLALDLVQRGPLGSVLTTEGTAVADWARDVVSASDRLESGVAALRRRHGSQLQVSASMTIAEYLMPRWLAELAERAPQSSVSLRMRNSQQVAEDVLHDAADVGFVETPRLPAGLHKRTFAEDELVIVVGRDHPWRRKRKPRTVADLAAGQLIVREEGSGTRDAFEHALRRAGVQQAPPRLKLGSTAAIKAAVHSGQGIGVLSRLAVAADLAAGRLHAVPVTGIDLRRKLRIVWRSGTHLTGPAGELAGCAVREP